MTTQTEALKLALEALEDNQHLVADNERHAYVMEYNDLIEKCKEALAQPEHEPVAYPEKCPITRRDFFMLIEHPTLGLVPTYGGPYDSYTIPHMEGTAEQLWHERELVCHRFDHDEGYWMDDVMGVETIPMRVISEGALNELLELKDTHPPVPTAQPKEQEPVAWIYEDELPESYPYDAMFEKSRVIDGVRMFPQIKNLKHEPVLIVEKEPAYMSQGHYYEGTKPHIDPTKVWKLAIGTKLYTTPPQRKPLPPQSPCEMTQAESKMFKLGWLECEAAHDIKENA